MKWTALALVAALAVACAPAQADQNTVIVTIEHSRFSPDQFEFPAGATVKFVIHNTDPIDHEFIVGDEAVQLRHENGTEKKHGARPGEVSIPAGETRTTTYTFADSTDLIVGCHLPAHYDYGMRAEVTVTP
jgi:uncharacterized cupredoxin-like copper-binding protein